MDPLERRRKIYELAEQDEEYRKMKAEYDRAQARFTRLTDHLPRRLRNLLWTYPGMGYFLHHRMLTLICETMSFPEE